MFENYQGDGVSIWFDTPDVDRGSYKKARGSILISYIDILSESIANLQYRIFKQLFTGLKIPSFGQV